MIVGLSGVAKSGKDSFYNIAEQFFLNSKIKTKRLALADLLKSILSLNINTGIDPNSSDRIILKTLVFFSFLDVHSEQSSTLPTRYTIELFPSPAI